MIGMAARYLLLLYFSSPLTYTGICFSKAFCMSKSSFSSLSSMFDCETTVITLLLTLHKYAFSILKFFCSNKRKLSAAKR